MLGDCEAHPERNPSLRVASAIVLFAVLMACNVETTPQPTGSPSAIAPDDEGRPAKKE